MRTFCTSIAFTAAATLLLSSAAIADTFTVYAYSVSFSPDVLNVAPGDTIVWQYSSGYPHTVTSGTPCTANGLFDSPLNGGSPTFTWTVPNDASGVIPYFCDPHCFMGMTAVLIVEDTQPECPADIDGNGVVNVTDLLDVIAAWGDCPGCAADINGDGVVNVTDVLTVIADWGDCG